MDQIKIGKFIAECRKKNNLTQMQLAEKLNITDRAIKLLLYTTYDAYKIQKGSYILILEYGGNNNYQFMNQIPNKFNNRTFNFEKEDDFNLPDDLLNKDEMNYFNNKNLLFGKNSSFEPKINSKYESPYNDDYMNSNKEEKNKFEPNYENNMNLGDNIFINNNYNPSNEIIIQNNGNIGFGIDNRVYNNYYQINLTYPFNLEQMFLKDNFNY